VLGLSRRAGWVRVLLAIAIAGLVLGGWGEAERDASPADTLPDGFDSREVAVQLDQGETQDSQLAIVLFTADEGELSKAALAELSDAYPPGPQGPSILVAEDGTAALHFDTIDGSDVVARKDAVEKLRGEVADLAPDGVTAQVTGPAGIEADLASVFDGADSRLLIATAAVVGILLLITYRSVLLWLVPLAVVGTADQIAAVTATQVLKVFDMTWDDSTIGILSVLVFGAGTDYALLLISRYRDELYVHEDRFAAMRVALRNTSEAVISSAVTVVVALLALLLSLFPATRALGLACALGVVIAAGFVLLVLPWALVLFGRWIFWPMVPKLGTPQIADSGRSLWGRIGNVVSRRPRTLLVLGILVVAALATGTTSIKSGLSNTDQFLQTPPAITAAERLAESFPAGTSDPTVVLTKAPMNDVIAAAEANPGVEAANPADPVGDYQQISVTMSADPGTEESKRELSSLREDLAQFEQTIVGGNVAQSVDTDDAAQRDQRLIIPIILVVVLVSLGLLLRSIVAPILLVVTVVATFFAALGASWWLFTGVFGFERADVGIPLLAFLFLVALGVDYNIFLVTRAAEEAKRTDARTGMLRSLAATGGVITSAGILLAAVFAVLGVLPLVVLAQLGIVICVGVLLDTLLVRTIVVPALAFVLGDRFWWPRKVS
jgi:putative drug exporter of the RND superfamily